MASFTVRLIDIIVGDVIGMIKRYMFKSLQVDHQPVTLDFLLFLFKLFNN